MVDISALSAECQWYMACLSSFSGLHMVMRLNKTFLLFSIRWDLKGANDAKGNSTSSLSNSPLLPPIVRRAFSIHSCIISLFVI